MVILDWYQAFYDKNGDAQPTSDLEKWFNLNHIEYKLEAKINLAYPSPRGGAAYYIIECHFNNPSDEILFKLTWC